MTVTIQSLADRCIMVRFRKSTFTRYKRDKAITDGVEAQTGVKRAGNYNKKLLVDCDAYEECEAAYSAAYTYYHLNTTPWLDEDGQRMLRNDQIMEFSVEVGDRIREAAKKLDVLDAKWLQCVAADVARLKSMGNPLDYPNDIRSKYHLSYSFRPIPVDFRTSIPQYELDKLDAQLADAEKTAVTHAISTVMEPITAAVKRLAEIKGEKGEKFHESIILNIQDATKRARKLNMMADPVMDAMFAEVDSLLTPYYLAPKQVKTDESVRENAKSKLDAIMAKMGGMYGAV